MFGKFFAQTFTGSMRGAGPTVFAVWGYIISNQLFNGSIELNPQDVADRIGCTVEDVEGAIAFLMAPDPKSRTKTSQGRRLLHDGGFLYTLVNGAVYRNIKDERERREYFRVKKQESRERKASKDEDE